MTVNAYQMLFTDQNTNREFVIQPYTRNGPQTPTTGVDPTAATANTTLFLYGKGTPDYGERLQEDMIFMLEHFNNPTEPSFPVPGQLWSNTSVSPPQMYVYNAYKYTVVSNSGNTIAIQSTGGLDSLATVAARFSALGLTKSFTVYSPTFVPFVYTQTALPTISMGMVLLTVSPATPLSSMTGYITGGWEDIWQGNTVNVMRTSFNANGQFITNVPTPTQPGHAANKAYVDAAITGGTLTLSSLSDVQFATPGFPQTNSVLYFDGTYWTDKLVTTLPFVPLSGGTMTGPLILSADPLVALGAATKQYVDAQPLSGLFTNIVAPTNLDLLSYNGVSLKWENKSATAAGVLPLSGGTMTGVISMGGNKIVNLGTPTVATDAVTKAYADALVGGASGITSANYNNATGVLTINQVASPTTIAITGFLPTPGNQVQSTDVNFVPQDPALFTTTSPSEYFQAALATVPFGAPNNFQDPANVQVSAALSAINTSLGNFTVPRQRIVMTGTGTNTAYNFATGAPNLPLVGGAPGIQYVVGTSGLSVYINGLKQLASDRGLFKLTNVNTTTNVTGITFSVGTGTLTVPGNFLYVLRAGVRFVISGTSTVNDGGYTVSSVSTVGPNTVVVTTPDAFSSTPGTASFVASGTGTLTYGPYGIMPSMQTGYTFGGPSNIKNLSVSVNGNAAVTLTIDTATTDCDNFGLLTQSVNTYARQFYINSVIGCSPGPLGSFLVPGNRTTQFPATTSFVVRYSSGNNGSYTVGPGSPVYNPVLNQTTIPVTGTVPVSTVDGILFQDNWGFVVRIENGSIVFYSNVAGAGSAVLPVTGTLLTDVTGLDWPVTISSLTGTTNAFTPQQYSYKEVGVVGYQSSLIEFTTAPQGPSPGPADVIEIIVDHDMIYRSNPVLGAVTA